MHARSSQQGFTLVEIAIVLVIISLLFAAVMKAQSLIERSKVKTTLKRMDEITAAAYTFLDKYNQLPGDAAGLDLDGDGTVDNAASPNDGQISNADFWLQMHKSGMLSGSGTSPMTTAFRTPYAIRYNAAGFGDNAVCALLPPQIAEEIDTRYDNGDGTTGAFRITNSDSTGEPGSTAIAHGSTAQSVWLCTHEINTALVGH